jgi:hypothetical protein
MLCSALAHGKGYLAWQRVFVVRWRMAKHTCARQRLGAHGKGVTHGKDLIIVLMHAPAAHSQTLSSHTLSSASSACAIALLYATLPPPPSSPPPPLRPAPAATARPATSTLPSPGQLDRAPARPATSHAQLAPASGQVVAARPPLLVPGRGRRRPARAHHRRLCSALLALTMGGGPS